MLAMLLSAGVAGAVSVPNSIKGAPVQVYMSGVAQKWMCYCSPRATHQAESSQKDGA